MEPGVLNLNIEQGATYDQTVTVRYKDTHAPYDLSSYTSGTLNIMVNWWSQDVKFQMTTANGRLTLGGPPERSGCSSLPLILIRSRRH